VASRRRTFRQAAEKDRLAACAPRKLPHAARGENRELLSRAPPKDYNSPPRGRASFFKRVKIVNKGFIRFCSSSKSRPLDYAANVWTVLPFTTKRQLLVKNHGTKICSCSGVSPTAAAVCYDRAPGGGHRPRLQQTCSGRLATGRVRQNGRRVARRSK
jgi:hypothetical protein